MKNLAMPTGNITYFNGDITKIDRNAYGFFKVEVETPQNLYIPILQLKHKTNNGLRTISPLGNWTGWFYSEEINNAKNFGYKFNIIEGYIFEQRYVFNDYVDRLYNMKSQVTKDNPLYTVSKLLLNSLYGRFGMKPEIEEHIIIDNEKSNDFSLNYKVLNTIDLDNGKELIKFTSNNYLHNTNLNISIPVAAAITSLARIYMTQFKNNKLFNVLYTDTDSVFTDNKLPDKFIGNNLGKMKLENIFKKTVFLAPKLYGGITIDNKEIIKIKGFKESLNLDILEKLLIKDSKIELSQEKWYRNFSKGEITIKDELYTIMVTENKRTALYKNNIFYDTEPFKISD